MPPSLHFHWAHDQRELPHRHPRAEFLTFIVNSIVVTGSSTLIALVLGVPAAYAFSRLRFRGSDTWASTILSFRFMPPVAVAIPIYLMIRQLGLLNSYLGLILPYVAFTLPLVVWIMIGFFDEIPREIDEAALVDGCSPRGVLWRVLQRRPPPFPIRTRPERPTPRHHERSRPDIQPALLRTEGPLGTYLGLTRRAVRHGRAVLRR